MKQALLIAAATVFLSSLATTANAQCRQYAATNCGAAYYRVGLFPRLGLFARCRYTTYAQPRPFIMTPEKDEYIPTDEGNVPVERALCVRQATNGSEEGALCAEAQIVPGDVAGRKTLLEIVNATRARFGRAPLVFDATLERGAIAQATFCSRIGGLRHASGVAEILAQNTTDFSGAIAQWLNSPAHLSILLSSSYRRVGIGVVRDQYGRAWHAVQFR